MKHEVHDVPKAIGDTFFSATATAPFSSALTVTTLLMH
jgi:hypothetical protein